MLNRDKDGWASSVRLSFTQRSDDAYGHVSVGGVEIKLFFQGIALFFRFNFLTQNII